MGKIQKCNIQFWVVPFSKDVENLDHILGIIQIKSAVKKLPKPSHDISD